MVNLYFNKVLKLRYEIQNTFACNFQISAHVTRNYNTQRHRLQYNLWIDGLFPYNDNIPNQRQHSIQTFLKCKMFLIQTSQLTLSIIIDTSLAVKIFYHAISYLSHMDSFFYCDLFHYNCSIPYQPQDWNFLGNLLTYVLLCCNYNM